MGLNIQVFIWILYNHFSEKTFERLNLQYELVILDYIHKLSCKLMRFSQKHLLKKSKKGTAISDYPTADRNVFIWYFRQFTRCRIKFVMTTFLKAKSRNLNYCGILNLNTILQESSF